MIFLAITNNKWRGFYCSYRKSSGYLHPNHKRAKLVVQKDRLLLELPEIRSI